MNFDDYNYFNDARTQGPAKAPVLYVEAEDGGIDEVLLPTHWEVCDVCHGEGKHVNPSIDCNGLTREDFADDPDFAEDYMRGTYDVTCNCCQGRRVVQAVDWDALTEEQRTAYELQLHEEARDRAEQLSELRMGA